MSVRDVIARELRADLGDQADDVAGIIIAGRSVSGYTMLGPDEIHAPSVERCVDVAIDEVRRCLEKSNRAKIAGDNGGFYRHNTAFHAVSDVAAALRELMKEPAKNGHE